MVTQLIEVDPTPWILKRIFLTLRPLQKELTKVKSSFKPNPTLETPGLRCELILVPFEISKLTHGLTPMSVRLDRWSALRSLACLPAGGLTNGSRLAPTEHLRRRTARET